MLVRFFEQEKYHEFLIPCVGFTWDSVLEANYVEACVQSSF